MLKLGFKKTCLHLDIISSVAQSAVPMLATSACAPKKSLSANQIIGRGMEKTYSALVKASYPFSVFFGNIVKIVFCFLGMPSRKRVELKCLATIIFSVFRRVKSRKVVLDIDSPRQNPQKN